MFPLHFWDTGAEVWCGQCNVLLGLLSQELWCWKVYFCLWGIALVIYITHITYFTYNVCEEHAKSFFFLKILLDESANEKGYITEAQTKVPIAATGAISIENAEISVLDSDVGSVESQKKYVNCVFVQNIYLFFNFLLVIIIILFLGSLLQLL